MRLAPWRPIALVPEQLLIAAMGLDMVDDGRNGEAAFLLTVDAQDVLRLREEPHAGPSPLSAVTARAGGPAMGIRLTHARLTFTRHELMAGRAAVWRHQRHAVSDRLHRACTAHCNGSDASIRPRSRRLARLQPLHGIETGFSTTLPPSRESRRHACRRMSRSCRRTPRPCCQSIDRSRRRTDRSR